MRAVFGLVLLLGVGLAGFAVYMAKGYVEQYQAALDRERAARAQQVDLTDVIITKRQIAYGERVQEGDIQVVKWPKNAIPQGAFTKIEDLFPQGKETPRTALRMMEPTEAVLASKVTEPGQDAGVSSRLRPGMRAFAIKVDVTSGVSGFLRPGDQVDVFWTGRPPGSDRDDFTKLIETGVRLIAVDQSADMDSTKAVVARTVTIEATPQQVASLAQAQSSGRLSLALVGAEDTTVAQAIEVDQRTLLGIEEAAPVVREVQRVCTVKTRKGDQIVETPIECTN